VHITTSRGVDLKTGRLQVIEEKGPGTGRLIRDICPASPGGKDWQPMAYSPRTGLIYIPHNNLCQDEEGMQVSYISGTPYVGANVRMYAGPGGHPRRIYSLGSCGSEARLEDKRTVPRQERCPRDSRRRRVLRHNGGLVQGPRCRSGQELWRFKTGSGVIGQPISYRGPDGKQYIAVFSGVGGWVGAIVSGDLDPRDPTTALDFVGAMQDLPQNTGKGGTLYVFSLL
jgi:glucose dehydrogenase